MKIVDALQLLMLPRQKSCLFGDTVVLVVFSIVHLILIFLNRNKKLCFKREDSHAHCILEIL